MNLKINSFSGRLGNNIIQLSNCIQIAAYYNYNIIIPYNTYFIQSYITINPSINKNNKVYTDTITNYFYIKNYHNKINFKNIDYILFEKNIEFTISILQEIFSIKNVPTLHENTVVIHIRGGDIFHSYPHSAYIMPPLSYYTNIINSNNFKKIIMISEDRSNPCVNKLLVLYPIIEFRMNTLDEDIKLLLGSQNVIESFGTFSLALLTLSKNIKNIYKPSYQFDTLLSKLPHKYNIFKTDLDDYKQKMSPWKNTAEQRNIMMTY